MIVKKFPEKGLVDVLILVDFGAVGTKVVWGVNKVL